MSLTKEDLQAMGTLIDGRLDNKLEPINKRLDSFGNRLDSLEESQQTIRASQLKVELDQYPRIAAALDGAIGGMEKNEAQDERLAALEEITDNHDIRLLALEQKAI